MFILKQNLKMSKHRFAQPFQKQQKMVWPDGLYKKKEKTCHVYCINQSNKIATQKNFLWFVWLFQYYVESIFKVNWSFFLRRRSSSEPSSSTLQSLINIPTWISISIRTFSWKQLLYLPELPYLLENLNHCT